MATDKQTVLNKTLEHITTSEDAINSAVSLTIVRVYAIRTGQSVFVCKLCYRQTDSCSDGSSTLQLPRIKRSAYRVHRSHCVLPPAARQICGDMPGHHPRGATHNLTLYSPMVTICTAQWSLYVPHTVHYMYRTVVTICTAQWSLYIPHSGHYMYRQLNIQQFSVLPTHCIYVFCVDLRTNSDYFPIQH